MVSSFHILAKDKNKNDTLLKGDFRKARIASIIACRLKSTRLPRKAVLNIGGLPSVELCLKHALALSNVDYRVLATSTLPKDDELAKHTFSKQVILHRGDPENVISRFIGVIDRFKVDIVLRFAADIIYPSDEILQLLLKSHFESGADYTAATNAAHGTSMEIMNASALKKMKVLFSSTSMQYSEYLTYYFTNNPNYFKLNFIELPPHLSRDYRLTLDYREDLELFNMIETYFQKNKLEYTIGRLFEFLDKNPQIATVNKHIQQIYKSDKKLANILKKVTTIKS